MRIDIISVFPQMFTGFLGMSIMARAQRCGAVQIRAIDLRDFARDVRRTVDDKMYGGGAGMLMRPDVWYDAVESIATPGARILITAPTGKRYTQAVARTFATAEHLVILCGHYEGFDARVMRLATDVVSIGDYVLTGGELAAAVIADSVVRLLPGVLGGGAEATANESFTTDLLEAPQYTRPPSFRGMAVPETLVNGNHSAIAAWRKQQAYDLTVRNRPDLLSTPAPQSLNSSSNRKDK